MTIGTPTVNNVWQEIYYTVIFLIIIGFAVYDVCKKRVPDKALVCFIPVALAAPVIQTMCQSSLVPSLIYAVIGAASGFIILLSAAVLSAGGNGIGGGDIKLAAVLGFIYGTTGIIYILMIASVLAVFAGVYIKRKSGGQILRLPFVPFIATGTLAVTLIICL